MCGQIEFGAPLSKHLDINLDEFADAQPSSIEQRDDGVVPLLKIRREPVVVAGVSKVNYDVRRTP